MNVCLQGLIWPPFQHSKLNLHHLIRAKALGVPHKCARGAGKTEPSLFLFPSPDCDAKTLNISIVEEKEWGLNQWVETRLKHLRVTQIRKVLDKCKHPFCLCPSPCLDLDADVVK